MPASSMDDLNEERRKAIAETIHAIGIDELKSLGEGLFPYMDHPWRTTFFHFVEENATSTFHHATTDDGVHFIYCDSKGKGMWFMPGSGMGPLQAKGIAILKDIVAKM